MECTCLRVVNYGPVSLIITGNRSTDWWKSGNGNGGVYHRQELAQGPYRAIWHIPKNGDIGAVTADFM